MPPGSASEFQPGGDVDAIAVEIGAVLHDVAEVDADAKPHLPGFRQVAVLGADRVLDFDAAAHGLDHRGEFGDDGVAPGVDLAALMALEKLVHDAAIALQPLQRVGFVAGHQRRIALHVGAEDGRQLALHLVDRHGIRLIWPVKEMVMREPYRNGACISGRRGRRRQPSFLQRGPDLFRIRRKHRRILHLHRAA